MKRKGVVAIITIAVLTLAAGALALRQRDAGTPGSGAASAPGPHRVMQVAPSDLGEIRRTAVERSVPVSGTLRPYDQVTVKAEVAGELLALPVREGQAVREGQVIARFDDTETRIRIDERTALLEAARAELEQAKSNWEMQRKLLEDKFISQNAADNMMRALIVAEANLRAADAQLELARKALDDAIVRAPMSGTVAERHALPGEKLAVDDPLVTIVNLGQVELEGKVPASRIAAIRIGTPATFQVEGIDSQTFSGEVARINPSADEQSRMFKVYVVIQNPRSRLRGGMFATGALIESQRADALTAPLTAIREDAEGESVLVLKNDVLERAPVRVGLRFPAHNLAELLDGPPAGTQVVAIPQANLRPGDRVQLLPSTGKGETDGRQARE